MAGMPDDISDVPSLSGTSEDGEVLRANQLEADLMSVVAPDSAEYSRIAREGEEATQRLDRRRHNKMSDPPQIEMGTSGDAQSSDLNAGQSAESSLGGAVMEAVAAMVPATEPVVLATREVATKPPEETEFSFESSRNSSSCACCDEESSDELDRAVAGSSGDVPGSSQDGPWLRVSGEGHLLAQFRSALRRAEPEAKMYMAVRVERNSSLAHLPNCPTLRDDGQKPQSYSHLLCNGCASESQVSSDRLICSPGQILHSSLLCPALVSTVEMPVLRFCPTCFFNEASSSMDQEGMESSNASASEPETGAEDDQPTAM